MSDDVHGRGMWTMSFHMYNNDACVLFFLHVMTCRSMVREAKVDFSGFAGHKVIAGFKAM